MDQRHLIIIQQIIFQLVATDLVPQYTEGMLQTMDYGRKSKVVWGTHVIHSWDEYGLKLRLHNLQLGKRALLYSGTFNGIKQILLGGVVVVVVVEIITMYLVQTGRFLAATGYVAGDMVV